MKTLRGFPRFTFVGLLTFGFFAALQPARGFPPPLPDVWITAPDDNAAETGPNVGVFRVWREGGDLTTSLFVYFETPPGGSAQYGTDYELWPGTMPYYVEIPADANSVFVTNTPVLDANCSEGTETVVLTLAENPNYSVIWPDSATHSIADAVLPSLTTALTNRIACPGANVTFQIVATGTGPLTNVWKHNGATISGQTNNSLTLTNVSSTNAGTYQITVSGHCGSVTNSATLTVLTNLSITGPTNQTVCQGSIATFSVSASGSPPIGYQWIKNTTNILSGQTNSSLVLTNVAATNAGTYAVVVSGPCNSKTNSAILAVEAISITVQPTNTTVFYGAEQNRFFVQATGSSPLYYQWRQYGTNIAGATINSYNVPNSTVADSGTIYSVVVSNTCGTVVSSNAQLTVLPATLTIQADNKAKLYCATNPPLSWSATGFVHGEGTNVLSGAPVLSTTVSNTSIAGTYVITITNGTLSASNYVFTFVNGQLVVVKAPLTVTAANKSTTYGAAIPTLTWSITGFVNGEGTNVLSGVPSISTPATNGSPAGTYPITPTVGTLSATNYAFGFINGTLTVAKVSLTVTANDTNRIYGAANPVFTASYSGFVNGDNTSVLSGYPSLTTTAVSNTAAGIYANAIIATNGTLSAANYSFGFVNGTLTITKASLTVQADDKTKYAGEANPPLTYSFMGLLVGDGTNVVSGAPSLSTADTNNPGSYAIVITTNVSLFAANYGFVFSNGVLTVLPSSSDIIFANSSMDYLIGAPPTVLDTNVTVTAKGSASFTNVMLMAHFADGLDGDHLSVFNIGSGSSQVGVTNVGTDFKLFTVSVGSTNVGTLTPGSHTNDLVVQFNTNGTAARVQAVARCLTYCNTSSSPSKNQRHIHCSVVVTNVTSGCVTSAPATFTVSPDCPTNIYAVLVIDRTTSMNSPGVGTTNVFGSNRLAVAKSAAISFLDYPQFPTDRVRVISFCGLASDTANNPTMVTTNLFSAGSGDKSSISNAIAGITTMCGNTVYHPSLKAAYTNLVGFTNSRTLRLILFLTDGELYPNNDENRTNALNYAQSNRLAQPYGIRLVTIGLGGGIDDTTTVATNARVLLTQMASSPSDFHISTNGTGLTAVYAAIANSICLETNQPPWADAGPDTTNIFTTLPGVVNLAGSSGDNDNLPTPHQVTNLWSKVSGPANVSFSNPTLVNSSVTFTQAGTYVLQLLASDTALSVTDTVTITIEEDVLAAPTVFIITPPDGRSFNAPATIQLTSIAQDTVGVVTNVAYYTNGAFWKSSTASPYRLNLTNVLAGGSVPRTIQFTAVATSTTALMATSPPVSISIIPQPPTVSITAPPTNAQFALNESIVIPAVAGDVDGVVTNVQFRAGTSILGNKTNAPYSLTWTNGLDTTPTNLIVVATDNDGLSATSSVPVTALGCVAYGVTNLVLSVSEIIGGGQLTGTVILSNAAMTGGQAINLYSTNPAVVMPSFVYVPQGDWSNSFTITTLSVAATNTFTVAASYHGQPAKTAGLTVDSWQDGSTNAVRYCGPMDVAVLVDLSASMGTAVNAIKQSLAATLDRVELASGGDYRLALVTFGEDDGSLVHVLEAFSFNNRVTFEQNFPATDTGGADEPSHEALNTVINCKSSGMRMDEFNRFTFQNGDFTNCWRDAARKIVVLFTDELPNVGGISDGYQPSAHNIAVQAQTRGILISAVNVHPFAYDPELKEIIMRDYAETTGGAYMVSNDGTDSGMALDTILSRCGASEGMVIFVRDDQNREYDPITTTGSQSGAKAAFPSAFNTKGIWGNVNGARFQRAGTLLAIPGSKFDVELGVGALTNDVSSFGLLFTNAHQFIGINHYSDEWELPTAFYPDAESYLDSAYFLNLTNHLSSRCGQDGSVTDTPEARWPWDKNILTLAATMDRLIPQGRCRDFVLADGVSPLNGTWDIVFRDQIIASSGQPNGWDVEEDYTAFGGHSITVPATATVDYGYEVRVRRLGWEGGKSAGFTVLSSNSIPSASVLLPLVISTNTIALQTDVTVTVALDAPAPFGDAYVPLYTNGVACKIAVIRAGQTSTTTNISVAGSVGSTLEVLASYNGYRKARVRMIESSCTTPPSPEPYEIKDEIDGAVVLTWAAVPEAMGYNVSRGLIAPNFIPLFNGLTTNRFVDNSVLPGTTYIYKVSAYTNWCSSTGQTTNIPTAFTGPAPTPWIVPFGGTFHDQVDVLVTNYTQGTVMYFTTNGTAPDYSSYDASFTNGRIVSLSSNAAVQAFTRRTLSDEITRYNTDSRLVLANFTIVKPTPITCGNTNQAALTLTNAHSTVEGPGFFSSRFAFVAGVGDVGKRVTVTASSSDFDTLLFWKDGSTNVLDWNDDYSDSTDSQIIFRVPKAGTNIFEVSSFSPYEIGNFSLSLVCADLPKLNVFTNAHLAFTTNSARIPNLGLIDFGVTNTGITITNFVTVTNGGYGLLTVSGVGAYPDASTNGNNGFSVSPTNFTLAYGAITNLAVTLRSDEPADFGGYLRFQHNDEDRQSPFFILLTGRLREMVIYGGTPLMAVLVSNTNAPSYTMLDFGQTTNNTARSLNITITNQGEADLNLTGYYFTLPEVFSISPSPVTNLAPTSNAVFTLQFLSTNSGQFTGSLLFTNNDPGENPFVLHLTAISNPGGTRPTVSITAPANNSQAASPANITISATATPYGGGVTITNVEFLFQKATGTYSIGNDTSSPYSINWQTSSAGYYALLAVATDSEGRRGVSAPINVQITTTNLAPIPTNDYPTVLANSINNVFHVLANDSDPNGDPLTIVYVTPPAYGSASIIDNGQAVRFSPLPFMDGGDGFSYDVSDGHGGVTRGRVWITVEGGPIPHIDITNPVPESAILFANTITNLTGEITPPEVLTNIVRVEYRVGGDLIGVVTNAPFTNFAWHVRAEHCECGIQARIFDKYGQFSDSYPPVRYTITNASGWYPQAAIDHPTDGTYLFNGDPYPHTAIVQDGILVVTGWVYQVQLKPDTGTLDKADYKVLIKTTQGDIVRDSGWITNKEFYGEAIYTNDLTTLRNDVYDLELLVRNEYAVTSASVRFALDSNLKIGPFTFSEQDLVIPVNGLPLTVVRTYDSMNPKAGDFGYSWTYAINDMDVTLYDVRSTEKPLFEEEEGPGPGGTFTRRTGGSRDVTLTLPDGRRTTFYYYEKLTACVDEPGEADPAICAKPAYQAAPGVTAKLRPVNQYGYDLQGYDLFTRSWHDQGDTFGRTSGPLDDNEVDPHETFDFPGFILTLQDGTEFYLPRDHQGAFHFLAEDGNSGDNTKAGMNYVSAYGQARVKEIRQRSGDKIVIGDESYVDGDRQFSIKHFNPSNDLTRSIYILRDEFGRISALKDPIGSNGLAVVKYEYDNANNLSKVLKLVNRSTGSYITNQYFYEHSKFPHYLTKIIDSRGNQVARNLYDDNGKLIGIINASGQTNRFVHDVTGRQEIKYDPSNQPTVYHYDTKGNVLSMMDPLGHTNGFAYDANGNKLSSSDALGHTTYFTNDADGNVLSVVLPHPVGADPAAYTTHFTYDQYREQTSLRLPTGALITNEFDADGNLAGVRDGQGNLISATVYDGNGLPKTETDKFGSMNYRYDALGNLTFMTNSLGKVVESGYDDNGNLTGLTDNGTTSTITYDGLNRESGANYGNNIYVNYGHEGDGDWTTVSGPTLGSMERHQDEQGRLSGWKTANDSNPGFSYDINGRLEYETNSIGVVTFTRYDAAGRVIAVTNLVTGAGNAFGYDEANRRTTVTNALGYSVGYAYNPDGSPSFMTNQLQRVWTYGYDTGGACCGGGSTTTIVTDPFGRQTMDLRSAYGLPVSTIWRSGNLVSSNYIEYLGGMTTEEQEAEEYPVAITDEGNRTRRYDYDDLGRLYRATDLSGATWWTNGFDAVTGALTNVISPTGETNSYTYDDLDNVKTIKFSDGNSLTNLYNDENRLSGVWLPTGTLLTNFYDFAGRLTNRQAKVGAVVTETASFEYNGNDAVTKMIDNTGSTTNLYDAAGRLWGIDYPSGASVRFELDKLDRITGITNKASAGGTAYVTQYQYDAVGNVTNVVDPFNGNTSFEYDRVGRKTKRTLPNSVVTEWQYDWRDRVTNITHKIGGTLLAKAAYVRAASGEPTKITREDDSYVELKYDAALRLTNEVYKASGGSVLETISYGYDAAGNRTNLVKGGVTLTNSVSGGYRITAVKDASDGSTEESYSYDNGGRVMQIVRDSTTLDLGYNSTDQVAAVTNGANWVVYVHDANGRRTVSTNYNGSTTVRRLLVAPTPGSDLESPHLIANASGAVQQGYVYLGDEPLLRYGTGGAGSRVYYLEDGMGNVIGLAPNSSPGTGNTTRLFYDGFGNARLTNGPAPSIPTGTGGDFRFHGAWLEEASGLYNMRARDYDVRMGRFSSKDPVEGEFKEPETMHPYAYANNNAYIYSDPSGGFSLIEIGISELIGTINDLKSAAGGAVARRMIMKRLGKMIMNQFTSYIKSVLPLDNILEELGADPRKYGQAFQKYVEEFICSNVPMMKDWLWLEPRIRGKKGPGYEPGDVYSSGIGCGERKTKKPPGGNIPRPDFVISPGSPLLENGQTREGYMIGEMKWSGVAFKKAYLGSKPKQAGQWAAITGYAKRHSLSKTALFISYYRIHAPDRAQIMKNGANAGVLIAPVSVISTVKK